MLIPVLKSGFKKQQPCANQTPFQEAVFYTRGSPIIIQKCTLKESQTSPGAILRSTRQKNRLINEMKYADNNFYPVKNKLRCEKLVASSNPRIKAEVTLGRWAQILFFVVHKRTIPNLYQHSIFYYPL